MDKEKSFISAVIYVHNDSDRIETFLRSVTDFFENNFEHSEIICVNDNSSDMSAEIIKNISKKVSSSSISIINLNYYHGLEAAMYAGQDYSIGDFVFEFDEPLLDFDVSEIMRIYQHSLKGYDIVSASPEARQSYSSGLFYYILNRFSENNYHIGSERFRVLSRRVINRINSMDNSVPYRKAVYSNCGLKTDCLKYRPVDGMNVKFDYAEKKYRASLAVDSIIMFTNIGYRIAAGFTAVMFVITTLFMIYSLVVYITGSPVEGWTTIVLFLSVCFMGLFGILSIVIKYLQIAVNLLFKKNKYNYESIEKLTK